MTYSFRNRMDRLGQRKKALDFVLVTVSRIVDGDLVTGPQVHATEGVTSSDEIDDRSPGIIQKHARDFVLDKADYLLDEDEDPVLPQLGDIITTVADGVTYELIEVSGTQQQRFFANERCFSYTTPTKKRIRIHTNQTSAET